MAVTDQAGLDALHRLKSTDLAQWLMPSLDLSQAARTASKHLFSCQHNASPFDHLLVDGFDAEQIWQQIDLQLKPVLSSARRKIKQFEKNPEEISKLKDVLGSEKKVPIEKSEGLGEESDGFDEELDDGFDEDDEEEGGEGESEEREEEGSESEEEEDEEQGKGVEDKFLKIKELKDYLKKDEAGEFGSKKKKGDKKNKKSIGIDDDDEDEDEDGEEEDDELGLFEDDDEDEEDADKLARYDDFFVGTKKKDLKRKSGLIDDSEDSATDDEEHDDDVDDDDDGKQEEDEDSKDELVDNKKKDNPSRHEKELEKVRSKIEQMEKANLEEKTWTMQGEVTAAKRPKNSALEVDLDFEHNVRPAPVITEEVTASLEELIRKRILEERFDDVQKAPKLTLKAPREIKELDENKSQKGLAEVYEEEYVQKTDMAAPLTFSDEQKREASMLFKKICLKLDALSHFHFAPKPVIEDMSIQTNVPALAMEEIAPVAVSDAAMLAPEEVYAGKGDIKEEAELTQAERKRRRANKKRKFKAENVKRMAKKSQKSTLPTQNEGKEE